MSSDLEEDPSALSGYAVVVLSYRQNVHAYPSGGGDYEVATVNLGPAAGVSQCLFAGRRQFLRVVPQTP